MTDTHVSGRERRSSVDLTPLSLGGAQLGNLYVPIDDEAARETVDAAWSEGIRTFDTAPHYGLGLSERRLGAALAGRARGEFVLSTKVGRLLLPQDARGQMDDGGFAVPAAFRRVWDFSRDGILRSLAESLERLGLDRVDIVYLHDPDEHRDDAFLHAYPALEELRSQGVVSAIGAGMNQTAMLADFARHTDVDVLMLAGRYTLLDQSALDDLLPACVDRDVVVVAAGVFNSGLLARPAPTPAAHYEYRDRPVRARRSGEAHRRGLRAARHDAPCCCARLPARPPGCRQRLHRRPLARAGRAEHRARPCSRPGRALGRAEGGGPPAPGRAGACWARATRGTSCVIRARIPT